MKNDSALGCITIIIIHATIYFAIDFGIVAVACGILAISIIVIFAKITDKQNSNKQNHISDSFDSSLEADDLQRQLDESDFLCHRLLDFFNMITSDTQLLNNQPNIVNANLKFSHIEYHSDLQIRKDTIKLLIMSDLIKIYKKANLPTDFDLQNIPQFFFSNLIATLMSNSVTKYNSIYFNLLKNNMENVWNAFYNMFSEMSPIIDTDIVPSHPITTKYLLHNYNIEYENEYTEILTDTAKSILYDDFANISYNEVINFINPDRKQNKDPIIKSKHKYDTDSINELSSLIGLHKTKGAVESLTNFIKIQNRRRNKGLSVPNISYHCVFSGNPGTGKTTVARMLANIYKDLGIIKKGHLIETDRSGLVAEYVGQTAVKTNQIIDSALDGVLFIDEAYTLISGNNNDYGNEAIATLLKRMEDNRDRLIVILAGYNDNMKKFIDSNPGLQSRFSRFIEFEDYSADELLDIFLMMCKKNQYHLSHNARNKLKSVISKTVAQNNPNFGNARFVRNLFESTIENQANRIADNKLISDNELSLINSDDINF